MCRLRGRRVSDGVGLMREMDDLNIAARSSRPFNQTKCSSIIHSSLNNNLDSISLNSDEFRV